MYWLLENSKVFNMRLKLTRQLDPEIVWDTVPDRWAGHCRKSPSLRPRVLKSDTERKYIIGNAAMT